MKWIFLVVATLVLSLSIPLAEASSIRLLPLRLDMNPRSPNASIELTNLADRAVAVQVEAFSWKQENGQDIYNKTDDLFYAPPIVRIPARDKVNIRFRMKKAADVNYEKTYRVYFQEVAAKLSGENDNEIAAGMQFKIRFGVPLFYASVKPSWPSLKLTSNPAPSSPFSLKLKNSGTSHLKIKAVLLYPEDTDIKNVTGKPLASGAVNGKGAVYILGGSSTEFTLPDPKSLPAGSYKAVVMTDFFDDRDVDPLIDDQGLVWLNVSHNP